jgi:Transposase, Mutator family
MCNAGYGEVTRARQPQRARLPDLEFGARTVTMELKVPKFRRGSYCPAWLFTPRK